MVGAFSGGWVSAQRVDVGPGALRGKIPPLTQFYRRLVSIPGYGSASAVGSGRKNTGFPKRDPWPKTDTAKRRVAKQKLLFPEGERDAAIPQTAAARSAFSPISQFLPADGVDSGVWFWAHCWVWAQQSRRPPDEPIPKTVAANR